MKQLRSDAGFSLVEMMVVVAIVGLMASAVVLAMPGKESEFKEKLVRAQAGLEVLARRSVMTGRILGVRFNQSGFDTFHYSDDGWQEGNDILKSDVRRFPAQSAVQLAVAGTGIDLSRETVAPHIWFLPTGEQLDFELRLSTASEAGTISPFATGGFVVKIDE